MMKLFSLHGVHTPHKKDTAHIKPIRMAPPTRVVLPMAMHIGRPAEVQVKVGDAVCVGTMIGAAAGPVSSPVFSSVSGKVVAVQDFLLSSGATTKAVVIESDGEMTVADAIAPPVITSREALLEALASSGIVGLGGAGFPTHVKLNVPPEKMEYLVINGAECEPYVTSDTQTMQTRGADMAAALKALAKWLGARRAVIGIEANKPAAIAAMRALASELADVLALTVQVLPATYPQGGEKVLIYHTTGRVVPTGKLPIDMGCVVLNCTTLAAVGAYLQTGMPLVEKCVTVAGGAVKHAQNVLVPIGTSMADIVAFCGGYVQPPHKLLYGGPMMGITAPDDSAPVLKNTNALLALTAREAKMPKATPCIHCGSCVNHCPFGLAPFMIATALERRDATLLEELAVMTCMECGCCSFVCPANRPLVQNNKLAKVFLREEKAKEGGQK
ncbi:MAG: electron transport complex subunit RsxC [Ruminococcaceae bacterium]|nr:electron transport complex subunit RsxC [Oscillospiraceae bacterium]